MIQFPEEKGANDRVPVAACAVSFGDRSDSIGAYPVDCAEPCLAD